MAAVAASTSSTDAAQPVPSTSQSALIPGLGSAREAAPIGIQLEATIAAATPSVAPATAASPGASAADAAACRRVSPTARSTRSSATAAEAYLATDWPTRTSAASSAASPNASRQAASYPVTFLAGSPIQMFSSSTSMSDRPVTRARSARNAGIAASPPASRIRPLM